MHFLKKQLKTRLKLKTCFEKTTLKTTLRLKVTFFNMQLNEQFWKRPKFPNKCNNKQKHLKLKVSSHQKKHNFEKGLKFTHHTHIKSTPPQKFFLKRPKVSFNNTWNHTLKLKSSSLKLKWPHDLKRKWPCPFYPTGWLNVFKCNETVFKLHSCLPAFSPISPPAPVKHFL